jgi:multidrug efflux pump subunit AcrA (membrane-fusion protein)
MGVVGRGAVDQTMDVTGTVQPVSQAVVDYQVSGQVATLPVALGDQVTAGEVLSTLQTASLSQAVTAAQSTLTADEAQLTSDEKAEITGASTSSTSSDSSSGNKSPSSTSSGSGSSGTGSTGSESSSSEATIVKLQQALVNDQQRADADTQQESADLAAEQSACASSSSTAPSSGSGTGGTPPTETDPTGTPSSTTTTTTTTAPGASSSTPGTACSSALAAVLSDQQNVQSDQSAVASDENALGAALNGTTSEVSGSAPSAHASVVSGGTDSNSVSKSPDSSTTVGPAQIDQDQATIDGDQAAIIEAQQSLEEAQLTSPIAGTIVSEGLSVGQTVPAGSTTDAITIIGARSFELAGSLTSSQVQEVQVGQQAVVQVDGLLTSVTGNVTQVGPVSSSDSGISYPVVVTLPSDAKGVFDGSTAVASIITAQVTNAVTVPTSALHLSGTTTTVELMKNGKLVSHRVVLGVVGNIDSQIKSGLAPGERVVLADYAEPVPSSSTLTGRFGGFGGGGFGGGGFARFGGGAVTVTRVGGGEFTASAG